MTFLRQHELVPEVPVVTQEEPQVFCLNSRKTKSFSPQCEMRPFSEASREIPPSLSSLERVLDTLEATQEVPPHTHLHSRGTMRVPLQLKKRPIFPPHLEMRVHFPHSSGKESHQSRCTSRGGGLNLKVERNSTGRATILKDPIIQVHSRYTGFPCSDSTITPFIHSSPVAP